MTTIDTSADYGQYCHELGKDARITVDNSSFSDSSSDTRCGNRIPITIRRELIVEEGDLSR